MKIEINVELSTADGTYHFDIFINNKHYDGGIVEVNSYEKAVRWIANNMLNHVSTLNHIRSLKK
tara:strand:+ start:164 stop:355 length:192 start_codon:yes stop_codon:yes gene_type:complete